MQIKKIFASSKFHFKFYVAGITTTLLLLPLWNPTFLKVLVSSSALILLPDSEAHSKEISEISSIAKKITVKIEGATSGSGVLVKEKHNRYTVLTAWHVIKDISEKEELAIFTFDGKEYLWDSKSRRKINNLDLGIIEFESKNSYKLAVIGDSNIISEGEKVFVAGYPLRNKNNKGRFFRFKSGELESNINLFIEDGYQLLYSNKTLKGMSGGPLLNQKGNLIGMHCKTDIDQELTSDFGKVISNGTNKAIPISYYKRFNYLNKRNSKSNQKRI